MSLVQVKDLSVSYGAQKTQISIQSIDFGFDLNAVKKPIIALHGHKGKIGPNQHQSDRDHQTGE